MMSIFARVLMIATTLCAGVGLADVKLLQLPQISVNTLPPPYLNYPYFEGYEELSFDPYAEIFDLGNAWFLSEMATLAYADPGFAVKKMLEKHFTRVKLFTSSSTQCYVASNEHFVIVAFRGTESRARTYGPAPTRQIVKDVVADLKFRKVPFAKGGKVHRGFFEALNMVWEKQSWEPEGLGDYIRLISADGAIPVWFTGHSLGAALANIAYAQFAKGKGLYTFGSPRTGDTEFAQLFRGNEYRIVNNTDVVSKLPPEFFGFAHVGKLIFIDCRGRVYALANESELSSVRKACGAADELYRSLKSTGVRLLIPDAIVDHVPTIYSTHLKNNLIKTKK